jgi:hypothetical protein
MQKKKRDRKRRRLQSVRVAMEMYSPHPRFDPCFAQEHKRPPPTHVSSPNHHSAAMFALGCCCQGQRRREKGKWWKHERQTKFISLFNTKNTWKPAVYRDLSCLSTFFVNVIRWKRIGFVSHIWIDMHTIWTLEYTWLRSAYEQNKTERYS